MTHVKRFNSTLLNNVCGRAQIANLTVAAASIISFVYLTPLFLMLVLAFIPEAAIRGMAPLIPSASNISEVISSGDFALYIRNSAYTTGVVILANTVFALMAGYAFARYRFPLSRMLFLIVLASMAVPRQVLIVPLFILFGKLGLRNTLAGIILPFVADGFNIFLMKQTIEGLPVELEEAAKVDGCSDLGIIIRIVAPLCRPAMAVAAINTAIVTWNNFLIPLIMIDDPRYYTLPLGLALFSQGPQGLAWGQLMAGALISALPVIIIFLFLQKHVIGAVMSGAVKG